MQHKEIKRIFTRNYLDHTGHSVSRRAVPQARGEVATWQRRFWEHSIRREQDLNRHMDYLPYNPVEHGLVKRPVDWHWSGFRRFVKMGYYEKDWEVLDLECGE